VGARALRILSATDLFEPAVGGLERAVDALGAAMAARGHHVRVATLALPDVAPIAQINGQTIHRLPGWQRALRGAYQDPARPFHPTIADPGIVRGIIRLVDEIQPDVLHAHGWILHSCIQVKRLRPHVPLVVTLHDYSLVCPNKNNVRRGAACDGDGPVRCMSCSARNYGAFRGPALTAGLRGARRGLRAVDAFVPISRAVAEASRPALPDGAHVRVIASPVSDLALADAAPGVRPSFVPADEPYLMFAGEVSPHKGIDVLLDAHARMGHRPHLVVCASRRPSLPLDDIPNVTVVVSRPHVEILTAWRHCAVAVVPSVWQEPLGLSALEAMASGAATVGTLVGGLRTSMRDGVDGLLVPPADARALALAITQLLDDPDLARRLGESARERARPYAAARIAEQYEALYTELMTRA
jgi:glycosyltransferase involved in cell wall biosynthesis